MPWTAELSWSSDGCCHVGGLQEAFPAKASAKQADFPCSNRGDAAEPGKPLPMP